MYIADGSCGFMASPQALRGWMPKHDHRLERALRVLDSTSVNMCPGAACT